jgi:crotonobetainyl-CoA:carnitine CoA-transferase CaiB-like acyl-CoA transferase
MSDRTQSAGGNFTRLKVLDVSTHWSGSMASRHLAHFGADVVKLENPKIGDGNRALAPLIAGEGMSHLVLNAGKRSVAIDRRSQDWDEVLRRAVEWADVFIVGSQPGMATKRALDFEAIAALNPRIIYCNISGYGEIGPWADYPLHGLNGDAAAGLVDVEMADGLPVAAESYRSVGTSLAGIHAALGILEAVRRRDQDGMAQRVSASVWESSMFWQWRDVTTSLNDGAAAPAYADLGSRYAMYQTADARVVLVCPIERKFWESFCDLLDLPAEWKIVGDWSGSGMDWGKGRTEERRLIADRMRLRPLAEWITAFDRAGIPFSPLYTVDEAAQTAQAETLAVMTEMTIGDRTVRVPNVPVHIGTLTDGGNEPKGADKIVAAPQLGEHTAEFLREIGLPG